MNSVFLIDGGFFTHKVKELKRAVEVTDVVRFVERARAAFDSEYRLLRIYYYDCAPSEAKAVKPISRQKIDYKNTPQYTGQMDFLSKLRRTDFVSVREGRLIFRGWSLKKTLLAHRKEGTLNGPFTDSSFEPDFEQKGVDIKIGLDIAWISMGGIAQRIYLVTGDSDFIPAMKFARRAGVQVYYFTLAHGIRDELKDHADVLIEKPLKDFLDETVPAL